MAFMPFDCNERGYWVVGRQGSPEWHFVGRTLTANSSALAYRSTATNGRHIRFTLFGIVQMHRLSFTAKRLVQHLTGAAAGKLSRQGMQCRMVALLAPAPADAWEVTGCDRCSPHILDSA